MIYKSKIWDYDPKEITKLLSEFAKSTICEQLGIGETTLNNYIKAHQIQYTKPLIIKKKQSRKSSKNLVDNSAQVEVKNPFELFKEEFEKRKKERMIRELKDGYY
jgi:hypothetical protein